MKSIIIFLAIVFFIFSVKAQKNISISFSNDNKDVYHLSLIIYTPDGKIQTRLSNLNTDEVKSYYLPGNTEIYIAENKQEAFAIKGNVNPLDEVRSKQLQKNFQKTGRNV